MTTDHGDRLHRFLLPQAAVRGQLVSLDDAWREIVSRHDLPACVRDRLGELAAAGLLLAASLKFDGKLVLQIHGDGPVSLLVVECDAGGSMRATAQIRDGASIPDDADLGTLVNASGRGRFALTLDPGRNPRLRPYQGIVPLEGGGVAEVLERYFARSEQVPSRLWLAADAHRATGLLLQRLPTEDGRPVVDEDGWNRLQILADTSSAAELLTTSAPVLLERLFGGEPLGGFEQRACRFECGCSREKVAAMLRMLGREEVDSIVAERGTVDVRCEYCNQPYRFDRVDSMALFESTTPGDAGQVH